MAQDVEGATRRTAPVGAAVLALLVLAVAVAGTLGWQRLTADDATGSPVELSLPGGDVAASCVAFDEAVLAGMRPAFAARVTAVEADAVRLRVDRWYRPPAGEQEAGGEAEADEQPAVVVLRRPDPQSSAALDGVAFALGQRYLVTAADGVVNGCGFSGPATPELEAAFDRAFAVPAG